MVLGLLLWTRDDSLLPAAPLTQTLKTFFDNVLLELGGLPHVLPSAVHLDPTCA